ncbi:MAG: hypothetical protein IKL96_05630 [Kiritimatiellae bacterium]|nr:hypothetical protein [Kiritimatiellia bacterium]
MSDYEAHGDSELTHLHPGESVHLTAVVTNCHADAYLGCTWHGGAGISFSDAHSLTTTVAYASLIPGLMTGAKRLAGGSMDAGTHLPRRLTGC